MTATPPKGDEADACGAEPVADDTAAIRSWTARISLPSRATLRRRALLADLHVPMDGPVQLAQRIEGVPAAACRRRAGFAAALVCGDLLAGLGVLGWAAESGLGALVALGVLVYPVAVGARHLACASINDRYADLRRSRISMIAFQALAR
ncbi:hypothetical protein KDK95_30425 [Actinospica sp. MGRD01-02]|uniref:Uncharacterized protein n=1 Tax=Actinospica acidithermotolerans TaxID=2828514 RepID=A0A941EFV4_9ACTN|nr:hypothetical protein [Actinospica acidithermotolerans]MBR7830657.1 hypothetical protein [Actinospica acidithermotolerans]